MVNRVSMRRIRKRSFILITCVRNRMHYWACSSTVEQGTHNPLVLGSNPGGPTKNFQNGHAALRRGRFLFPVAQFARPRAAWEATSRVICSHFESYGCIRVHLAKPRAMRANRSVSPCAIGRRRRCARGLPPKAFLAAEALRDHGKAAYGPQSRPGRARAPPVPVRMSNHLYAVFSFPGKRPAASRHVNQPFLGIETSHSSAWKSAKHRCSQFSCDIVRT